VATARCILIGIAVAGSWLAAAPGFAGERVAEQPSEQVIQPELDRRSVHAPRIDADDFEVAAYAGILSVEDFGAESLVGARVGYHITEDLFIEGTYARSTVSDQSYYRIGFPVFEERETDLDYYHLSLGINLFPGEIFVGRSWATTSAVYLVGGVGNTGFDNRDYTTFNFGFGLRVLTADWFALRLEMRDLIWQSDLLGVSELKHNFEFTLGASLYF
jgi:outer membrane beta-barrel protein